MHLVFRFLSLLERNVYLGCHAEDSCLCAGCCGRRLRLALFNRLRFWSSLTVEGSEPFRGSRRDQCFNRLMLLFRGHLRSCHLASSLHALLLLLNLLGNRLFATCGPACFLKLLLLDHSLELIFRRGFCLGGCRFISCFFCSFSRFCFFFIDFQLMLYLLHHGHFFDSFRFWLWLSLNSFSSFFCESLLFQCRRFFC